MRHRMCGLANMSHSNQMHPANTAVVGVRPSPRIIAGVRSGWKGDLPPRKRIKVTALRRDDVNLAMPLILDDLFHANRPLGGS